IAGAKGYKIIRKAGNSKKWSTVANITKAGTVSYTDKTVKNGAKYTYAVQAVSGNSVSSYKETVTYFVGRGTVSDIKSSARAIKVTWKRNSKVTGYQVCYSLKSSFKSAKTKTYRNKTTKTAKLTGLKSGRKYYVRVRSYIKVNGKTYYGAWSKVKTINTKKK
ncbi:MAG: fibronectin type III domain-containing protein, partial [Coprococcus sp.]